MTYTMTSSIVIVLQGVKMVQIATSCRVWKLRYQRGCKTRVGNTSRVDSGQLWRPKFAFIKIFNEIATVSQNVNCRSNLPEMLMLCSIAFPNIQEYYLFLAPYVSKINRRTKSVNKKIKNTKGLKHIRLKSSQKLRFFF